MSPKVLHFCILAVLVVANYGDDLEIVSEILVPAPEDCERKSQKLDVLSMHYVGTLTDTGVKFDSSLPVVNGWAQGLTAVYPSFLYDKSHDRDQPFEFQLGTGQVIRGWDEGLLDMCVGEKRKLTIPASKGYGETGAGDLIPPNAGLTFEVELLDIKAGTPPPNVFKEIDADSDKFLSPDEVAAYLKRQADSVGEATDDQHKSIITEIFNHEDKDKDGLISHEEFSGPKHDEL